MLVDNSTSLKWSGAPISKVYQGGVQIWPKVVAGPYTPNPINNSTAALPTPSTGTNYYISNVGSSETNTGTSSSSPWPLSMVQKGYGGTFFNNANILFRAGETFYGKVYIAASGTVRYQSYGAGPRPIITTMRVVPGSTVSSNWTTTAYANVWKLSIAGLGLQFRPRIWLNDVEGTRARYPQDVNSTYKVSYTNDGTNGQAIYVYATSNPATFYSSIKSPNFDQSTFQIETALTFVKNLDIRGATGSSIDVISTASGSVIEDCVIGLDSNGSGVRFSNVDGFEVKNNDFKTGYITKGTNGFYDGSEGGDCISLYSYNSLKNINVHHNNFYDWIHSSFWVEQQGGADKPMVNLQFRYNYCTSPNLWYSRAFGCYGYLNSLGNSIYVENNTMYDFQIQNQIACPGLYVRYNIIDSFYNGDKVRENTGVGNGLQIGHGTYYAQNMTITNNDIKNCEQTGIAISGEFDYDPTSTIPKQKNNIISSNTFTNNGFNVYTHPDYEPPGFPLRTEHNVDLYIYHRSVIQNNTFQNNIFNRATTDKCIFYGHDPSGNYLKTTTEFNAMNGTAGDVISGNSITLT